MAFGLSPSKLLNGRQIRTKIDSFVARACTLGSEKTSQGGHQIPTGENNTPSSGIYPAKFPLTLQELEAPMFEAPGEGHRMTQARTQLRNWGGSSALKVELVINYHVQ